MEQIKKKSLIADLIIAVVLLVFWVAASLLAINPAVGFGKPVIAGTGIPTAVLAERFKAGESVQALAEDYGAEKTAIEEAIRVELDLRIAA